MNERQIKVINRIFQEGVKGFDGALNADIYIRIAQTSLSTATRDLQHLVQKSLLKQKGSQKGRAIGLICTSNRKLSNKLR